MDNYQKHYEEFKALNGDLFVFRRKRRIKLLLKIAILEAFFVFFAIMGSSVDPIKAIIFSTICGLLLPFLIFDPQDLFRRPYIGKITGTKYMMRYVFPKGVLYSTMHVPGGSVKFGFQSFIRFTVEDEKGKKHRFTLPQHFREIYRQGDTVMLISGLDYPVCYTKRKHAVCMKCGAMFIPHKDTCDALFCGALLPVIPEKEEPYGTYEY